MKAGRPGFCAVVAVLAGIWQVGVAGYAIAEPVGITVDNKTVPSLCSEVDNVYVALSGDGVSRFRVAARHPAYIGTIVADSSAADYTDCDRSQEQYFEFRTRRQTLYEDRSWWLIGYVFERYWRTKDVPVRVGGTVARGLHMIQLWRQGSRGPEEMLVLYPPDGYWRLRPLSPAHLSGTAYGSSVLIGPVEEAARPLVEISEVTFDREALRLTVTFDRGGSAVVDLVAAEEVGTVLDVSLVDLPEQVPFAALRSMYVMPIDADVAEVGWRAADGGFWRFEPIPTFRRADDVEALWLGRTVVSRHNTSAPDIVFDRFSDR